MFVCLGWLCWFRLVRGAFYVPLFCIFFACYFGETFILLLECNVLFCMW
jgi:hypothetical protein